LQKACKENEFRFTEGIDACWSSHQLKYFAMPPTGGCHKG